MLEVFTDSWDSARRKAITEWCEETFGTENRPIHGILGDWKTGGATIHGWTWRGFASEGQMARFAARWPNDSSAGSLRAGQRGERKVRIGITESHGRKERARRLASRALVRLWWFAALAIRMSMRISE